MRPGYRMGGVQSAGSLFAAPEAAPVAAVSAAATYGAAPALLSAHADPLAGVHSPVSAWF
jgi:hypothetical protein